MRGRSANAALKIMTDRDEYLLQTATDRFERRLAEETGGLRVEMANGFARVMMIERDVKQLKWLLVFLAIYLSALTGLLALFR